MNKVFTHGLRAPVATLIVLLLCIIGTAHSGPAQLESDLGPAPSRLLEQMAIPGSGELQLIIQLTDPSVVEAMGTLGPKSLSIGGGTGLGASRMDLQSSSALQYRSRVISAQKAMMERISAFSGVRVQASVNLVMNAVVARVPIDQYSNIRHLPGVKSIFFSHEQALHLDTAATLQNAQALWDKAGGNDKSGKGVKIGIIDTGIDIDNPMFVDDSLVPPSGFPKGESAFTTTKVIVARNYMSLLSNPQTVNTAIDEVGHGSFVAGCAAGKRVTAPLATISGMAPGAFLGNYKIFGTPGINDRTNGAAVVAALEDAVADGMDVVNLSIGSLSYSAPAADPEIVAVNSAIAAGVVVVISAGNSGPQPDTINSPGSAPNAITVGSVSNSRSFASQLRATAPSGIPDGLTNVLYISGTGPAVSAKITSTSIVDVATLDGDGLGCLSLSSGSLTGKLAFISRGTCPFLTKVTNAANGGAAAVVVYNNDSGAAPIIMSGLETTTIPAVMIANPDGLLLKSFIGANPGTVKIEIDDYRTLTVHPLSPRVLSSFSSIGPTSDIGIKPDLVAVGENVYSAAQNNNSSGGLYSSSQFATGSGTSFASPMVAGAAAALKQLFPAFGPAAVKSALVTTASRNLFVSGTTLPNVMQAGSGLLDMGKAGAAGAIFTPTNLNFGVSPYSPSLQLTRILSINNASSISDQFNLSVEPILSGPSMSLSTLNTGSVAPGGSTSVSVSLQATSPLTGGFQGFIAVQSLQTSLVYRIPYWAGIYVPDRSRVLTVNKSAAGGAYGTLTDALKAAQPGNIIEIADSGTYAGGIVIGTNDQGLPLNEITVRAAAGFSPIIDGTGTGAADIRIVGLQNVLLQGLTITGGLLGLELTQPSASVPLSVTIDRCKISGVADSSASIGIYVDNGGTVQITRSTISSCSSLGIGANPGTLLTVSNSTLDSSFGAGIEAIASNVQILGTTVSNSHAPGAYLADCSGTIDSSIFARNQGTYGDGIEIIDGSFTITNNTWDTNDRYGILFSADPNVFGDPGPGGVIARNIVQSSGRYGIYLYPGQNVRVEGNLLKDNGCGMRLTSTTTALLANNIIVRSTDASNGNGVQVAGSSDIRVINNTIYGNKRPGISLSSSAKVVVYNSIISQNSGGDLQGFQSGNILFSLIGDGSITGNNNISGDPKFASPNTDVFDLSPGSPALDAGSNAAADLPLLDFYQRLRVAGAGSRPGDGKVDMGATEAGSTYPLFFPMLANGDVSALGDAFNTGFAVLNTGGDTTSASFTAYASSGDLLSGTSNPSVQSIASGAQVPILGFQLFGFDQGVSRLGAVLASSARKLAGFFLVFDKDFKRFADGVDVSDGADTNLIFMRHQSDAAGKTNYVLFNPGVNPASVTASLFNSSGTTLGLPKSMTIAPKGQSIFAFDSVTASSGYVSVRSDRSLAGIELWGSTSELAALRAVGASSSTEALLFFPHFAVNQGFSTDIGVVNTLGSSTDITLTAYGNDGRVIGGPLHPPTLAAGSLLFDSVPHLFNLSSGDIATGYIIASGTQGGLVGFTAFRYDNGLVQSAAAVPANSISRQKLLFSHIAHQVAAGSGGTYQTGIAILNPFGVAITFKMSVFDGAGNKVAEQDFALGPHEKVARILSHVVPGAGFFTQPLPLASGHIEVTSDYGLFGFELFFTEDYSQLASVPAQVIN